MKVRGWTWATSWAVVGLWASVTLLVAMASLAALFTPTWFVRHSPSPPVMFGVWAWCRGGLNDQRCAAVGQGVGDADGALPSAVWVMVGAVYGGGGALLAVTGLAALLTPILPTTHARAALAHVAGNIQAAAVSLQAVGLVLYPLGLGSPFARLQCGDSASVYASGSCELGYAYMLALVATALAAYCPVLARLVTYKDYTDYWSNLNYM
ncbi:LHFPL tetraspan subfamily member 7 protein-like [Eriocheir sinensis]|uniref:transmembrane protein 211-like n=1 Tax=Portunus trituberculatus TaxID=210409 RepID=UPI001E1CD48A|nr:transmembrane protein 211-like [Portunus trituberculatus]XP_045130743.1 transmembrane protein 211-like [Portunus trituberculatus]XP_050726834.1 LHFPL tetraspan subfamily member 7 protein-like [Eriocheir sinensis]